MPASVYQPAHDYGTTVAPLSPECRESVVPLKRLFVLGALLAMGLTGFAQAPPAAQPSPSEKELQAPLTLDDGKPTPAAGTTASGPSGWRALGSLVLVGGLAGGGLWAFRRWGARRLPGSGGTRLKVEETLALGDRRFVSILKVDDERFLIALSPQGVNLMSRLDSVEAGGPAEFDQALERQVNLTSPMAVRDVEAMLRRDPS
jgi:flagellar biogenesis protein FliO